MSVKKKKTIVMPKDYIEMNNDEQLLSGSDGSIKWATLDGCMPVIEEGLFTTTTKQYMRVITERYTNQDGYQFRRFSDYYKVRKSVSKLHTDGKVAIGAIAVAVIGSVVGSVCVYCENR